MAQQDISNYNAIEQRIISRCLNSFTDHPFDSQQPNARFMFPTVTVGGQGTALIDDEITEAPVLTIVTASVNVLGEAHYQLLNPQAWYCLVAQVNVLAKTTIDLDCNAHFTQTNISVLADPQINLVGACRRPQEND
jgi:hypothetical protein